MIELTLTDQLILIALGTIVGIPYWLLRQDATYRARNHHYGVGDTWERDNL